MGSVELAVGEIRDQRLLDVLDVGVTRHVASADRNDAARISELFVAIAVVQRGQQFAHCEVARTAKDDQVEVIDRQ